MANSMVDAGRPEPGDLSKLEPGWETLLAASLNPTNTAEGIVKTTKVLALLQMEGFPIPYKFTLLQMGPATMEVERRARKGEGAGILRIEKVKMPNGLSDQVLFAPTPKGSDYLHRVVLPTLERHPKAKEFSAILATAPINHRFNRSGSQLAKYSHEILALDDPSEFRDHYETLRKDFEVKLTAASKWNMREKVSLSAAAALDFGNQCLLGVRQAVHEDGNADAGKHFLVWNCEQVATVVGAKDALGDSKTGAKELERELDLRLSALEELATVYGYASVPTDDDLDAIIQGVAASQPPELS
ncbi:MAG: hypothetical protein V4510_05610 [bacterium]